MFKLKTFFFFWAVLKAKNKYIYANSLAQLWYWKVNVRDFRLLGIVLLSV